MVATSPAARGDRGHVTDDRSITARKYAEGLVQKEGRDEAIRRSKNWFASSEPVEIILTKDGRAFAVPKPAAEALRAEDEGD